MIRSSQSLRMTWPCPIMKTLAICLSMCSIRCIDSLKITKNWKKSKYRSKNLRERRRLMKSSTIQLSFTTNSSTSQRLSSNTDSISQIINIIQQLQIIHMAKEIKIEPSKRRGRPQKRMEQVLETQELFSIHDNVFHGALLFYTYHIFDKTPSRLKFNPTIGFSLYEKFKQLTPTQRNYYDNDKYALDYSQKYQGNRSLVNFFVNSMTFGPICVIDEFYSLFTYIIDQPQEPKVSNCLTYMKNQCFKFIDFNCAVLELLEVRSADKRKLIRTIIDQELTKFLKIIIHTLWALKIQCKQNAYSDIMESEEELFERRTHTKGRKMLKE